MMVRRFILGIVILLSANFAFSQLGDIAKGLGQRSLSDAKLASGLKEALRVGTDKSVKLTGRPDGYFGNEAIKILMPKNLRPLETGLRAMGYGPKVDDFVLSMNRAAEAAEAGRGGVGKDSFRARQRRGGSRLSLARPGRWSPAA